MADVPAGTVTRSPLRYVQFFATVAFAGAVVAGAAVVFSQGQLVSQLTSLTL